METKSVLEGSRIFPPLRIHKRSEAAVWFETSTLHKVDLCFKAVYKKSGLCLSSNVSRNWYGPNIFCRQTATFLKMFAETLILLRTTEYSTKKRGSVKFFCACTFFVEICVLLENDYLLRNFCWEPDMVWRICVFYFGQAFCSETYVFSDVFVCLHTICWKRILCSNQVLWCETSFYSKFKINKVKWMLHDDSLLKWRKKRKCILFREIFFQRKLLKLCKALAKYTNAILNADLC